MAVIASIGGRDWVLGMEWSTYKSVPKRADLLVDAGETESGEVAAPWYSLRITDEAIQGGFCEPVGDVVRPKKLASLAAMLADARQQPWLGVFEIAEDLYWYIAVRDHYAILPGGDVVGTEADVFAARNAHAGFAGWTFVEGDLETLTDLVDEVRAKRTPVRSLTVSRVDPIPTAIAAVVVAVLAGGITYGVHAYKEHERKVALARNAENDAKKPKEHVPDARDFLVKSPTPSDWLESCHATLATVPVSLHGWLVSSESCSGNTASVRWVRGEGASVEQTPPGTVDLGGEIVTQTLPVKQALGMGTDNAADTRTATLAMVAWGQRYGSKVVVGAPQPLSPKANVGYSIPVTIPMPLSPFEPGNGFDQIPGLRINGLGPGAGQSSSAGDQSAQPAWTVTGVIYARQ
jgi:hypothetical protein